MLAGGDMTVNRDITAELLAEASAGIRLQQHCPKNKTESKCTQFVHPSPSPLPKFMLI